MKMFFLIFVIASLTIMAMIGHIEEERKFVNCVNWNISEKHKKGLYNSFSELGLHEQKRKLIELESKIDCLE